MRVKHLAVLLLAGVFILGTSFAVMATAINLYVDSAPNVDGSSDYAPWFSSAEAGVANGTFVNMANGINPVNIGTTNFEIQDEVVYSFGDLGKRLTWLYWIPNIDVTTALDDGLQVSLYNTWDGATEDFYADHYGSTWVTPTHLFNYNGGVIGAAGMAWWGAYLVNTQEALDADLLSWGQVDESWEFSTRMNDGTYTYLTSVKSNRDGTSPVPEPTAMLLFGTGLIGLAVASKKIKVPFSAK